MRERPRIVVLASGSGTNCQSLIDACAVGDLDAQVVAVITNNATAGVLERADAADIATHIVDHTGADPAVRRRADQRLIDVLTACRPTIVVLAGWMRILGADVGASFPMVNLHPAKPGEYPGTRSIERAFEAWTKGEITESGVMVHWVPDAGVDVGPVIAADTVAFRDDDSLEDFTDRMHAAEHRLIVSAVASALAELG